jgi:hypothetical protein
LKKNGTWYVQKGTKHVIELKMPMRLCDIMVIPCLTRGIQKMVVEKDCRAL